MFLITESNLVTDIFENINMNMKKTHISPIQLLSVLFESENRQEAPFLNTGFVKVKDILS